MHPSLSLATLQYDLNLTYCEVPPTELFQFKELLSVISAPESYAARLFVGPSCSIRSLLCAVRHGSATPSERWTAAILDLDGSHPLLMLDCPQSQDRV
jgi:hypothetical protein